MAYACRLCRFHPFRGGCDGAAEGKTTMSIREKYEKGRICPDFEAPTVEGQKGCTHHRRRLCALGTHPVCEVWLRANPTRELPDGEEYREAREVMAARPDYRLAINAGRWFTPGWEKCVGLPPVVTDSDVGSAATRHLDRLPTDLELAAWKRLRVEVCMHSPRLGRVWLVPRYTTDDRDEISIDDAMTMLRVLTAFPGSRVDEFIRRRAKRKNDDA